MISLRKREINRAAFLLVCLVLALVVIISGCWKKPDASSSSTSNETQSQRHQNSPPDNDRQAGISRKPDEETPPVKSSRSSSSKPSSHEESPRIKDTNSGARPPPSSSGGNPLSAEEIYQRVESSLVLITGHTGSRRSKLGSGFLVESQLVVTNRHVVSETASIQVRRAGNLNEPVSSARIIARHATVDLALLRTRTSGDGLPLGDFEQVDIGESIYVAGNPQGLEATFSKGIVSGIRTRNGETLLQITAPVSHGSSGGPVLNEEGKVIGVVFAVQTEGQNLNFAVPVSYIHGMLRDMARPQNSGEGR